MHVSREQNEAHRRSRNVPAFYITTWCLHTWHSYMPSSWTVTARICSNQSVLEWITTNRLSTEWVLLPTVNNRLFFRFIHVIWNWKKVQLKENGRLYLSINFTRIFMSLCVCVCVCVYYYYRRMTLLFFFFYQTRVLKLNERAFWRNEDRPKVAGSNSAVKAAKQRQAMSYFNASNPEPVSVVLK